jgi:hypothetical protein
MPIDYKEYPANWKTEIRPAVLTRANNCCEDCGIPNHAVVKRTKADKWRKPSAQEWDMINAKVRYSHYTLNGSLKFHGFTKVVLTIAHLDHDKLNHDVKIERLKALCQRCHLLYDIKHHVSNRKYGRNHKGQHQLKIDHSC